MPTRMIREGFLDSEKVNELSFFAECFFHRLMLVADDYGRFDARPAWLRSKLFPLKEDCEVSSANTSEALEVCATAGLVQLYAKDGKPYGVIPNFGQRLQRKHSLFPEPPQESTEDNRDQRENAGDYGEYNNSTVIHRDSPQATEDYRESPPEVEEEEKKKEDTPLPPQRGESEHCQNQELILEAQAPVSDQSSQRASPDDTGAVSERGASSTTTTYPAGFDRFRKAYPVRRRGRVKDALRFWTRDKLEHQADLIIRAVELYIRYHKDWQKEECKYAPDIATFLNQGRWLDLSFVPESARQSEMSTGQTSTPDAGWWKPILRERYKEFPAKIEGWLNGEFWQLPPDVQAELTKAKDQSVTTA